jgi:TatD DNase family protein
MHKKMSAVIFSDSHIHAAQVGDWKPVEGGRGETGGGVIRNPVCAAAHSVAEYDASQKIACRFGNADVFLSFGIHPQEPRAENVPFLERLLEENGIDAIGETGFDLFADEYRSALDAQKNVWYAQLDLAARYGKPLVVHCRKSLDLIFKDSALLAKIPVCVFHSFAGSPLEARSLLKRGVNAYFSFGKPLLNNNKRAIACAKELALERLLAETDAPYQRLAGETRTEPRDIIRVHNAFAEIRGIPVERAAEKIAENFFSVFARSPRKPLPAPI